MIRDFIGTPDEWGDYGRRMTAWLNELALRYRTLDWESPDGELTSSKQASSNGRIREFFADSSVDDVIVERLYDGARTVLETKNNRVQYMSDGGTEIGRWNREDGYLQLQRTQSTTPSFHAGWSNFGSTYQDVKLYKDANGLVTLVGLAKRTGTATTVSDICQLPEDWRPATNNELIFPAAASNGAARIFVRADGDVELQNGTAGFVSVATGNSVSIFAQFYVGH